MFSRTYYNAFRFSQAVYETLQLVFVLLAFSLLERLCVLYAWLVVCA